MFHKSKTYDECCTAYDKPEQSLGAYELAQAIRHVATQSEPVHPNFLLFAEDGSIAGVHDLPSNVRVIYYKAGAPQPVLIPIGY